MDDAYYHDFCMLGWTKTDKIEKILSLAHDVKSVGKIQNTMEWMTIVTKILICFNTLINFFNWIGVTFLCQCKSIDNWNTN